MGSTEDRQGVGARDASGAPARGKPPLDRVLARVGITLGQLCYGALAVTVVSGVALAVVYDPTRPLESTEAVQGIVEYGFLIRSVHNLAAQLFFVTCVLHVADHLFARSYLAVRAPVWWRLAALLPVCAAAMFTGFVLRGDADAASAHSIAVSVTRQIPAIGDGMAGLFLGEPYAPLSAVFLHHAVTFTLLAWLLTAEHARRVWCGSLVFAAVLAAVTAAALVYHPGPGMPPGAAVGVVHGPWYFAGLESLMHLLPAWLVALLLPLGVVVLLGLFGHARADSTESPLAGAARSLRWGWLVAVGVYLVVSAAFALIWMNG